MPGGTGEIGGGSCHISFQCPGVNPAWKAHGGGPPHPVGAAGDAAVIDENAPQGPVYVSVLFPNGDSKVVELPNANTKIRFWWNY
jgi:hypothetical protein